MAGTSKKSDKLLNIFVCVGAAVVIFGAWAKILHKPIADFMLTVGLLTEALIFLAYAFIPPAGGEMKEMVEIMKKGSQANPTNETMNAMGVMMNEAGINPANLKRLSDNFQKLGTTVEKMSDIADISSVTGEFTIITKVASVALGSMKDAYSSAANTVKHFNDAADGTRAFHEQVQTLTKNLGSLNTIYELELQDTNSHLKAMNGFYSNLVNASQTLQNSSDDAKKTQEQIAILAKNLSNLNSVYGNMLAAMQGRA